MSVVRGPFLILPFLTFNLTAGRTDDKIFGIVLIFKTCNSSEANLPSDPKDFLNIMGFQNRNSPPNSFKNCNVFFS